MAHPQSTPPLSKDTLQKESTEHRSDCENLAQEEHEEDKAQARALHTLPHQNTAPTPLDVKRIEKEERILFFKQWIKSPKRLGTLAPISNNLARLAASCVKDPAHVKLVEIGAGPGRLTRALLNHGVQPQNLKAVELDPKLCAFAKRTLPHVDVIEGNAEHLDTLIPSAWCGAVDVVFSTIPLMCLPPHIRQNIMEASFRVLKPGGHILHLTYNYWSPLKDMPYKQSKQAGLVWNVPPAFIWRYDKI